MNPWWLYKNTPYALGTEAFHCISATAEEGYPPVAKSAEAIVLQHMQG